MPAATFCEEGEADNAKFPPAAVVTVRLTEVVCVKLPEVPVTVTVPVPVVAVPLAVNVSVLVLVAGFWLNVAVTPLGKPDADRFTLPVKPFERVMAIVLVPLPPRVTVRLLGDADKLKFVTMSGMLVECVKLPEVPVTVTVMVPVAALLLAVNVTVLVPVAGFGLNPAVTPLGRPEAERLTLPVNPFDGVIVIVLVTLPPGVTVTLLGDADRLKFEPPASWVIRPLLFGLPQPVAKS